MDLDRATHDRLGAARLLATRAHPYFTTALLALHPVAHPGSGTMGVDRWWRLYVDPAAVARWEVPEVAAVLVHEVGHLLRDHHRRAVASGVDEREAGLWNLAADAAINDDLVPGRLPLPDPVLPATLGLPPHDLEEVYLAELRCRVAAGEPIVAADGRVECGSGAHAAARDWEVGAPGASPEPGGGEVTPGVGAAEAELLRRSVADAIARTAGSVPGGWRRWAEEQVRPHVDWRRLLRRHVRTATRWTRGNLSTTYARPDRRADSRPDVVFPGSAAPVVNAAVVIDTSGSMTAAELGAAQAETQGALRAAGASDLWVVCCDAAAREPQRVRRLAPVTLHGGGGTDLRVGIAAAAAVRPRPAVIAVLTDGWTPWPDRAPRGTHVVVLTSDRTVQRPGFTCVRMDP